jgi:hypothetical protein
VLLQKPVERQALFNELRDEAAQGGKAPQHLLDPLEVLNRPHSIEGCNLLGVGLDPSLGNDIPQQHAMRHPEGTLLGVQFHPVGPQAIERNAQVVDQVVRLPGLYDYVVYVGLNGPPDVVSKDMLHTSLVCGTCVSKAKRHCYVAEHPKRRDEGSRELVRLFHFYLVVPGIGIKETQKLTPAVESTI